MNQINDTNIPSGIVGDMGVALTRFRFGQIGLIFREKPTQDHGIDGEIEILSGGLATGRLISAQIKCGASYFDEEDNKGFSFRFEARHYDYWMRHSLPVICVLVDHKSEVCYWAVVTKPSVISTGVGYKITIPHTQTITQDYKSLLVDIATPAVSQTSYEIVGEEDLSTGSARRIAKYVRLNASEHPWTRFSIRQLILQVTADARTSEYFRSEISAAVHSRKSVDVVWIYIYRSESDRALAAYIARAIWIDPELPAESRPLGFDGEIDSSGVKIEWNSNFQEIIKLVDERRSSKAKFLNYAKATLSAAVPLISKYHDPNPDSVIGLNYVEFIFELSSLAKHWDDEIFPPNECERLGDRIAELEALLGNAKIYAERMLEEEIAISAVNGGAIVGHCSGVIVVSRAA